MLAYQFVILKDQALENELAARFTDETVILDAVFPSPATDVKITFDKGYSRAVKHDLLTAKFGDGYSQRVRNGINSKMEEYSVNLTNRTQEEVEVITAFFDIKAESGFTITTGTNEAIKVICPDYTVTYLYESVYSISTKFIRVYEP